ncbi:MAG TPA: hypothetical protein VHY91_12655 [Pirellulales bacterium]|nr:hypothetical protein [Pirellulales bacterium]
MIRFVIKPRFVSSGVPLAGLPLWLAPLAVIALIATPVWSGTLEDALARFEAERPRTVEAFVTLDSAAQAAATVPIAAPPSGVVQNPPGPAKTVRRDSATAVDEAAAELIRAVQDPRPDVVLAQAERLLAAKAQVDAGLTELFALRAALGGIPPDDTKRQTLRHYLAAISRSIDLTGRLRYLEFDVFNNASAQLAGQPAARQKLAELFLKYRSSVGAIVMADILAELGTGGPSYSQPASSALRSKVLELIAATGETGCLPALAGFVVRPGVPPALVLQAVETIRSIGLPQDVHPGQDPSLPTPAITAARLHQVVTRLNLNGAPAELPKRRDELAAWLDQRRRGGLTEPRYRWGGEDLQPGDWLLMRNPSPYNLFTDLSPGLFTHVGVVALEKGSDGIQRMVLVDMPERGNRMPATNLDTFLERSRHYLFMRHPDTAVGRRMGETASSLIGSETEFDLTFRTDRVVELAGQPLAGKKITTYCAGLLLLCALETGQGREDFFPIPEGAAGGETVDNLAQLGISFGRDFISPTGTLFSPLLEIVGRREPTYDPRREVEEAIYDYFAQQLAAKKLHTSPDLYQTLRLKMAEAARHNSLLAAAMTAAQGVSHNLDLVSAAKAAAVVETLDEIAYGASGEFLKAQDAVRSAPADRRFERGLTPAQRTAAATFRQRHPRQYELWRQGQISRRQLRIELVNYYIAQGRSEIDRRFFAPDGPAAKKQ